MFSCGKSSAQCLSVTGLDCPSICSTPEPTYLVTWLSWLHKLVCHSRVLWDKYHSGTLYLQEPTHSHWLVRYSVVTQEIPEHVLYSFKHWRSNNLKHLSLHLSNGLWDLKYARYWAILRWFKGRISDISLFHVYCLASSLLCQFFMSSQWRSNWEGSCAGWSIFLISLSDAGGQSIIPICSDLNCKS